jgi:hypothetical protein
LLGSLAYWMLRRLFELVVLRLRSERSKELEILVLRHQLHVLQRQVVRPRLRPADRVLLAALSRSLPWPAWSSFFVSLVTLLRWHRQLVARRWTYPHRTLGRPRTDSGRCELVLRLARENPTWGYRRIHGELVGLGIRLAPSTAQASAIIACDFLTVDTVWLRRLYVLFFIELGSRVHFGGVTSNPHGRWVTQQARNLVMTLAEEEQPVRFLVRDRDSKFTRSFDEVFRSEGMRVIRTPAWAPRAKAHAERWVGSVRRKCLDRILILGRRQLEQVMRAYISHHNEHRPLRSLEQRPPLAKPPPATPPLPTSIGRRDRLGGLLHEGPRHRRVDRRGRVPAAEVAATRSAVD